MKKSPPDSSGMAAIARPRRSLRWLDSLMWLTTAGALAALLVPANLKPTAAKGHMGETSASATPTTDAPAPATAATGSPANTSPYFIGEDVKHIHSGNEFPLQNEADFISLQNAPPAPPAVPSGTTAAAPAPSAAPSPAPATEEAQGGPQLAGPQLDSPDRR